MLFCSDDNVKSLKVLPKLTPEVMEKIEKILENAPEHPVCRLHVRFAPGDAS